MKTTIDQGDANDWGRRSVKNASIAAPARSSSGALRSDSLSTRVALEASGPNTLTLKTRISIPILQIDDPLGTPAITPRWMQARL